MWGVRSSGLLYVSGERCRQSAPLVPGLSVCGAGTTVGILLCTFAIIPVRIVISPQTQTGAVDHSCSRPGAFYLETAAAERHTCRTCGISLLIAHFSKDVAAPSGRRSQCKACDAEARAQWRAERVQQAAVAAKWCPGCEQTLAAAHFYRMAVHNTGLSTYCKRYHRQRSCERNRNKQLPAVPPPEQLRCSGCCLLKDSAAFVVDKTTALGMNSTCKSCKVASARRARAAARQAKAAKHRTAC